MMFAWWKALFGGEELDEFFPDCKKHPVKYFFCVCIRFVQTIVLGMLIGCFLIAGVLALLGNGTLELKILGSCLIVLTGGGVIWLQMYENGSRRSK